MRPWTTHSFRDGALLLLLVETPSTFGRSWRLSSFITSHRPTLAAKALELTGVELQDVSNLIEYYKENTDIWQGWGY